MDVFIFYVPTPMGKKNLTLPDKALLYGQYHEWVKRLGEEAGLV